MAEVSMTVESTAFGVPQDANGDGTTAPVLRKLLQYQWQSPGVLSGGAVKGRADLRYDVGEGAAICRRSKADGFTQAWWPASTLPAVPAGDGTRPRVDVVWVLAHTEADTDNRVVLGVTTGTPSASPAAPAIPSGAVAVAYKLLPAGANTTSGATDWQSGVGVDYALIHGASMGVIGRVAENRNLVSTDSKTLAGVNTNRSPFLSKRFFFPTQRNVDARFFACVSTPEKGKNQTGVATVRFYLDGSDTAHLWTSRKIEYTENWVTYEVSTMLDGLSAGWHTVSVAMFTQQGSYFNIHYGTEANHGFGEDRYPGRVLRLFDMGIAK